MKNKLIKIAQYKMFISHDPAHELEHVKRVVENVEKIAKSYDISGIDMDALVLSAWWHDFSRSRINKPPSFFWMIFLDDIISAWYLFVLSIKNKSLSKVVFWAILILLAKSLVGGRIFKFLFFRKDRKILVDILGDADFLDVMKYDRILKTMPIAKTNKYYRLAYKKLIEMNLKDKKIRLKTKEALSIFKKIVNDLIVFLQQDWVYSWHEELFGDKWCQWVLFKLKELSVIIDRELIKK